MSILDRFRVAYRAFKTGSGLDSGTLYYGVDSTEYAPAEYGTYLPSSNAVYACSTLRAQLLSSLPLALYKLKSDGDRVEVESGDLWDLLHRVNGWWTFQRLMEMTELSLCLWGSAYWFLERGTAGRRPPTEIWWARPDRVRVVPHATDYLSHFLYQAPNGQQLTFKPSEVIWLRYPNPMEEFAGLSPLAAARLAADVASAAMKSNYNLFKNGLQMGGAVFPKAGTVLTESQAKEIEKDMEARYKGVSKAHRWGVFRFEAEMKEYGVTPKDAEFLGAMGYSLEEVCRAYKVPLDLLGGQRTYANVEASQKAIWTQCILPEAAFLAAEFIEQLVPMFPGQVDEIEFDSSEIAVLHEDETAAWTRSKEQITVGAITINEWRDEQGLDSVAWGDAWWAPMGVTPIESIEDGKPEPVPPALAEAPGGQGALPVPEEQAALPATEEQPRSKNDEFLRVLREWMADPAGYEEKGWPIVESILSLNRTMDYGGPEHTRIWQRFVRRTTRYERLLSPVVVELFKRLQESVETRLGQRAAALPDDWEPFDMREWLKRFRGDIRPVMREIIADVGAEAFADLGLMLAFNVDNPLVIRFLESRAQRFAEHVLDTTWQMLKDSLGQGITAGEGIPQLAERVQSVMGDRIRSTPENIARTEVAGAYSGGTLEAWRQSEVVRGKVWLASLDDRTRDSHRVAHGQTVAMDEDFIVGAGRGPAPGQIGEPEEDINCLPGDVTVYAEGIQAAMKRDYQGPVVKLTLESGRLLTITPNHPVLTAQGWIGAGLLQPGDNLVGYRLIQNAGHAHPDPNNSPAMLAQIFCLVQMMGFLERVNGAKPQFHGDGCEGQVNIVRTSSQLRDEVVTTFQEPSAQEVLPGSHIDSADLPGLSAQLKLSHGAGMASDGGMSSGGQGTAFFGGSVRHAVVHGDATIAGLDSSLQQTPANRWAAHAILGSQSFFRCPGQVFLDKVLDIQIVPFHGVVYNLQTDCGYYTSNGIVVSNCRCTMTAVLREE